MWPESANTCCWNQPPDSSAIADAHSPAAVSAAHLFLQRTLYRINRLAFFWCDSAPLKHLLSFQHSQVSHSAAQACVSPRADASASSRSGCAPLLARRRFDDLENYSNDRSIYLAQLRDRIEEPWQVWELSHMPVAEYKQLSPAQVTFGRRCNL